ncbi:DUF885 domain-containing protein [Williamsia sp. CHRR-6]|uniref:DUF885 domain-containing protein n=1 Tax=Williamsia sp. CHRR-6 TaxID=2835871 RepID=UPI001BD9E8A7|nr:DUF885 domain-containing protein [Williamsia sp. CHRR-6]MBT0566722.1 DUF885 domain-containing protein [Williamsia sp. CHRR-6]
MDHVNSDDLVTEYLRVGLAFDRLEEGFVDAYTGPAELRAQVAAAPAPEPAELVGRVVGLRGEIESSDLPPARGEFVAAHLRAMECSARRFAGEQIGFVDEVRQYFDVDIALGDPETYRQAHLQMSEALGGSGDLAQRLHAHRTADQIPAERVGDCVAAFSSALRERVREIYPLPDSEIVDFEVVSDKPWSGFNYYLGDYRSTVAINTDLPQYMSALPHLIAHEAYPGHHTEHCRKEQLLVGAGQREQSIFLVNTPQCLMAEGLADHALVAAMGPDWTQWAQEIYADLGLRFDGERALRLGKASVGLQSVRQDAALLMHDRGADADTVVDYLRTWSLSPEKNARQALRFLSSPLWRAYTSTYVEGYRLLRTWLDAGTDPARPDSRLQRFGRLLDEPLTPAALRAELSP